MPPPQPDARAGENGLPANPVIALLDGDPEHRQALGSSLEQASFRVTPFATPDDFLATWRVRPLPNAILVDLQFPGMESHRLLSVLEHDEEWALVPVVVMTADATRDDIRPLKRLLLRPDGFLPKPVDLGEVLRLLRSAWLASDPTFRLQRHLRIQRAHDCGIRRQQCEIEKMAERVIALTREAEELQDRLALARREVAARQRRANELKRQLDSLTTGVGAARAPAPPPPAWPSGAVVHEQTIHQAPAIPFIDRREILFDNELETPRGGRPAAGGGTGIVRPARPDPTSAPRRRDAA
jgi:CheY-like chemotaxis protein